jgi:hypothetical protein
MRFMDKGAAGEGSKRLRKGPQQRATEAFRPLMRRFGYLD